MLTHKDEDFTNVQECMKEKSVENSRMSFMIRCEMVLEIEGNFKDKFKRKGGMEATYCKECKEIETQGHCTTCPEWENICSGLNVGKIEYMVTFFRWLLKIEGQNWPTLSCTEDLLVPVEIH